MSDSPTSSDDLRAVPDERIVDARTAGTTGCAALSMTAFDALTAGTSFVLVADHDPRGIHYMLDAERPGAATWEPLEEGPELWRTRVRRVAASA